MISDVFRSLKMGGHFIFDTRNPLVKVWEEWEKDKTPDLANQEEFDESLKQIGFSKIKTYGDWEFKQATSEDRSFIFHCVK